MTVEIGSSEVTVMDQLAAAVWCMITLRGSDSLLVGVVYRSPSSTEGCNDELIDMADNVLKTSYTHVMIDYWRL